ncbi:agmatine/peptidylarginine deiminase [Microbacterium sp. C7(2022)]|uniref:agmatine deiminase family protein n=1 Tax=Microbacterium sp. C7(2022) TaxID=2992759 RepID=UPI00237A857C|nr:agmatine deiminase family protein [Microbacterium sp. C7(2022)]MDE0546406.1 agmatine deiminase family protein [Microbacterium sp. C7(2022)]
MTWRMPAETARHARTWMAFPREGITLGESAQEREAGYAAWTAVAHATAEFEPVTMVVDPSEADRARRMLSSEIEILIAPLDEFWMRDMGPTFVVDDERPGVLGAVDWTFNGWGAPEWAQWRLSAEIGRFVAAERGAELVSSLLVNEGGGIHVDGEGTVLLTETVQLDPHRNPFADRARVEAEMTRTIGATHAVWLPRGLTRDYDDFGTNGHVDIVATIPSPGTILLHDQRDPGHPDHAAMVEIRRALEEETDAAGRPFDIVSLPAPATLRDDEDFVDWSYVNHLVVNDGVIACGFGEEEADATARAILEDAYPGRRVVTVDAREIFARGGGIHCITQQEPALEGAPGAGATGAAGAAASATGEAAAK